MENKVNEIEIPAQYKKLIVFYEGRLEIDPDTSLIKTQKKFKLGKSQVRNITAKYSKWATPSAYKKERKMIHDNRALGSLVADDITDKEYNEEYGGVLTSNDMVKAVKGLEKDGIDVRGMFAEFLQFIKHNKITEMTSETLTLLERNIPMKKTLKQQVAERRAKAEIIEAERRIKVAQSDIMEEYPVQYYHTKSREAIEEEGNLIGTEFEGDFYYNEDYKEMVNDFKGIAFYLQSKDMDKRQGSQLLQEFTIKWAGFRIPQAEELRQNRARKERLIKDKNERIIIEVEIDEELELEEFLKNKSITDLEEIWNEECGT